MTLRHARAATVLLLLAPAACRTLPPATAPAAAPPAATDAPPYDLAAAGVRVRVSFPGEGTVRIRLSPDGRFAATSFAVEPGTAGASLPYEVEERPDAVVLRGPGVAVRLGRAPLGIALLGPGDRPVAEEAAPIAWENPGFTTSWVLSPGARVYGLGDRDVALDHRGGRVELWNEDAMGKYRSFPVMLVLEAGRAHGLLVDSAAHGLADVGASDRSRLTYRARSGTAVDLYLLAGPGPKDVLARLAALTGRMPLPPRWALGYHQCRYSYMSRAEVEEVADGFRSRGIPLDAVWLDIDYQLAYRPFTVDPARFPDLPGMVAGLRGKGVRTVTILDPHVAEIAGQGYAPYDTGLAGGHLVLTAAGAPFSGEVWPAQATPPVRSVFPDFVQSRTRAWWGGLLAGLVDTGVAGIWNDMNEPAIFGATMPGGARHRLDDGAAIAHRDVHNAYGALNARATFEGLARLRPGERPFVLTRSAFVGAQRWAATWTGDNRAEREDLAATIPMILSLGLSGFPFAGADVGGFGGCPDPDLLTAWMELGAWQPFYRNHSGKGTCRREPWVNGPEHEARRKAAVEGRYRLLPYLYTAFEEASRTGLPVMRPLWLEYPDDPATHGEERVFLVGRELVVAPRLEAGDGPLAFTLPAGEFWDVRSGARVRGGTITVTPGRGESLRVYARAGAIVPQQPVVSHADQAPDGPLTLHVWPGEDCTGSLYLDDGASLAHLTGGAAAWRRIAYRCRPGEAGIEVTSTSQGTFPAWWRATEVVVHGVPRPPVALEGGTASRHDGSAGTLTVTVPGRGADWTVSARW